MESLSAFNPKYMGYPPAKSSPEREEDSRGRSGKGLTESMRMIDH